MSIEMGALSLQHLSPGPGRRCLCSAASFTQNLKTARLARRPHLFPSWRRSGGSSADTGLRVSGWMELRRSLQAQYGGAQRRWRREDLGRDGVGGRRNASGIASPWGALFLKAISSRLIVSMDLYFHFFEPSIETKFTFASCEHEFCPVERRMWSGPDGRNMLCKRRIKYWEKVLFVCLSKKRSGKTNTSRWLSL